MSTDKKNISMESDTFKRLKADMTRSMNKLIANMIETGVDEASMAVKLTISLDKSKDDYYPKFKHKVSYTVQQKEEAEGKLDERCTLEKQEDGTYALNPIQMEMLFK